MSLQARLVYHLSSVSSMMADGDIHPVSTGAAADTVAAHQQPQELVFYAGWVSEKNNMSFQACLSKVPIQFCPFAQRAWIALEEKQIPYQYQETNPYKKTPEFLGEDISNRLVCSLTR